MRRSAHRSRNLLTMLALSFAAAGLAEGAVRIRQWVRVGQVRTVDDTLTVDPETGLRIPVPNLVRGPIQINSRGFRGPDVTVPKPPGVIRLAFLGGSTTYCAEVSSTELTWPHLVWQSLRGALPAVRFDYVNAGVPGYGLDAIRRSFSARRGSSGLTLKSCHAISSSGCGAPSVRCRTLSTSWPSRPFRRGSGAANRSRSRGAPR